VRFYRTFAAFGCEASHLSLFRRDRTAATGDPGEHLLAQDRIYDGGGAVISLLGALRAPRRRAASRPPCASCA
jgi:dipeptidase E